DKTGTATHSNQTIHRTREKASRTVNRADTLGSKRSSRLSRSKRLKKQSVAVERSAAIERLERFEPAPLLDAHCPRPESLPPRAHPLSISRLELTSLGVRAFKNSLGNL